MTRKSMVNDEEHNIEFKHIIGQDMIEEVKQLFLEYASKMNYQYIRLHNLSAMKKAQPLYTH